MSSGELLRAGGPLVAELPRAHSAPYLRLVDGTTTTAPAKTGQLDRVEAWATRTHHARMQVGFALSGAFTLAVSSLLLVR